MRFSGIWLCLSVLILLAGYSAVAISCDSSLRILFPHLFTHCNNPSTCGYGPWGRWFYTGMLKNDSKCDSGKMRQQNRTRTASTPACESQLQPEKQERYKCMSCADGPWGRWVYTGILKSASRCASDQVRQYRRSKVAPSSACQNAILPSEEKYECK